MSEESKNNEQVKKEPEAAPKPQETAKTSEAKPAEVEKKKERPANCAACNKSFKHKHWYYKNGKYFCTKRCWEKLSADTKAKAAEAKAKTAEAKAKAAESSEPAKNPENPAA